MVDQNISASAGRQNRAILWLLPLAFVIHDAEEAATMAPWMARQSEPLHAFLRPIFGSGQPSVVTAGAPMLAAMAFLSAIFMAATAGAVFGRGGRPFLLIYAALLGAFFAHGFGHIAQALYFVGYTPGVVTAVLVVIPVPLFIYRHLRRERLSTAALLVTGCAGAALVVPGILLAWATGRALG